MRRVSAWVGAAGLGALISAALAAGTASAAPEPTAPGSSQWEHATIYADLDGDGRAEEVTVREVGPRTQTLVFTFDHRVVGTWFTADSATPLQTPRAVDINGDGRNEVLVAHAVGANTLTFGIWKYEPAEGAVRLTTSAGAPFEVYEGGGVTAISGYSCEQVDGGREFVTVSAQLADTDQMLFDGDRTSYSVNRNAMTVESRVPIDDAPRTDPRLATDPGSCAP